jgi:hypothetical protein
MLVCLELLSLSACVAAPPLELHAQMIPTPGKPPDLFAAEDEQCRGQAEQSLDANSPTDTVVGSALGGALIGAAAGNVMSGRHYDRTGSGALAGLVVGTAVGLNRTAAVNHAAQRRYDRVYERCMVGKGNRFPGVVYRQSAPLPPPPPSAALSYPPPPLPPSPP